MGKAFASPRRLELIGNRDGARIYDDYAHHPTEIRATLYYQAIPPFFLQDRFCTAKGLDTQRLYYLSGKLDTAGGPIQSWKLKVGQTAKIAVPEASVP